MTIIRPPGFEGASKKLWVAGLPPGDKTGWPECDQYFTVAPGMLTTITGWPSSGKSEWLDALALNLAKQGWIFAVYSPENLPHELHIAKLLEKLWGKPFGFGPTERMTWEEAKEGMDELGQHFGFIVPGSDEAVSMRTIMEDASVLFDETIREKFGLIVDPWNDLDHTRPAHMSETEYVRDTLGLLRRWARTWRVHVFVVAHPQKMPRDDEGKLPVPRPDMISGSQHWWNRSDNCITVDRELGENAGQDVRIYFQKVKFKHIGRPGMATLRYDRVTGRYHSMSKPLDFVPGGKR